MAPDCLDRNEAGRCQGERPGGIGKTRISPSPKVVSAPKVVSWFPLLIREPILIQNFTPYLPERRSIR